MCVYINLYVNMHTYVYIYLKCDEPKCRLPKILNFI